MSILSLPGCVCESARLMSHGRICPAARGRLRLCRFGFGRGGGGGGCGGGGGEAVGRWNGKCTDGGRLRLFQSFVSLHEFWRSFCCFFKRVHIPILGTTNRLHYCCCCRPPGANPPTENRSDIFRRLKSVTRSFVVAHTCATEKRSPRRSPRTGGKFVVGDLGEDICM